MIEKAGPGRRVDGTVDEDLVAEVTADRSIGVAATEVAAVLDWSPVTARIRIEQSMRLCAVLPRTVAALAAGQVDVGRARMIVDRTAVLSAELCGQLEGRVLGWVKGRSKARLETLVDREVILADPQAAERRRLTAVTDRAVSHRPDKDGMGVITALLPAEAAVLVFTLVDLIAQANKGLDGRTVDQRRADAITDIADELLTFGFVDLQGLIARAHRATTDTGDAAAAPPNGADDAGQDAAVPDATDTHPATPTPDRAPHADRPEHHPPEHDVPDDDVPDDDMPDDDMPDDDPAEDAEATPATSAAATPARTTDTGTAESGTAGSSTAGSSTAESSTAKSSTAESGTAESGTAEPATAEPATAESGTAGSPHRWVRSS